jgi:glycosyltransferase involved in cell wall biosynthesis
VEKRSENVSKKLKIAILGSAASIHTIKWANFLSDKGHSLEIYSFDERGISLKQDIVVHNVPKLSRLLQFIFYIPKYRKSINNSHADIVQVHSIGSYGFLSLLIRSKFKVITPWGSDILLYRRNILKIIIIYLTVRSAKCFTCDSREVRQKLENFGADFSSINIINFGVDTMKYQRDVSLQKARIAHGNRKNFTVVSTRSFEPIYDVQTLIFATKELKSKGIFIHVSLIGGGSRENQLKQMCKDLDIEDQINFVGRVDNAQLYKYLNSSDAYVSTALSDAGIAASTAEAMACELPCIISNVRENEYWIQDSINGFLFKAGDYLELAAKISILYADSELRDLFGVRARSKIRQDNDYLVEMSKVAKLYLKVSSNE